MNSFNLNYRNRLTQVVVLVMAIMASLLFSQVAHAQKRVGKHDRPKYRVAIHKSGHKACYVLFKKRTTGPKQPLFAFNRRAKNRQQLAETDTPTRLAGAN